MMNELKMELTKRGYVFDIEDDFSISIKFLKKIAYIDETLSDKLHIRIENYEGKKITSNTYKTINGLIKFMRANI